MLCSAVLSSFSCVQLFATPWTVARQAPLSIGFSRQEYWNGLSCPPPGDLPDPSPGDLPDPGVERTSLALVDGFFTTEPLRKPARCMLCHKISFNPIHNPLKEFTPVDR